MSQNSHETIYEIYPFLKWAGGKRWLTANHKDYFPTNFNRYIEPFFGSGAVFFSLQPQKAILSDKNKELISTYRTIKTQWKNVLRELETHNRNHSKEYYYYIRNKKPRTPHTNAARFIYLNRTCWNGLYRVNFQGKFNVPIGTKTKVILDTDNFEKVSSCLKNSTLRACDFEKIIGSAEEKDFIFIDPPYTVKHNQNNFIKYNEKLFSWDDQIRLKKSALQAVNRGASVLITNAHHPSVVKLYEKDFSLFTVKRQSVIAGNSKHRGLIEELLIRSKRR